MLNYAVRKGKASRNIATFVSEDLPKAAKPASVALTEDELKRLLQCADEPTPWAKKRGVHIYRSRDAQAAEVFEQFAS
jgi:hypothetical protein